MKRKFELSEADIKTAIAFWLTNTERMDTNAVVDAKDVCLAAHKTVQDGPHYTAGFISATAESSKVDR